MFGRKEKEVRASPKKRTETAGRLAPCLEGGGMLKTWSVVVAVMLAASVVVAGQQVPETVPLPKQGAPNMPETLPPPEPLSAPVPAAPATPITPPAAKPVQPALEDHAPAAEPGCGCSKRDVGCLRRIALFFSYRARTLTSIHEAYQPYTPQPPLYLYFLHPAPIEEPPHEYPQIQKNCWSGSCSAGPRMFALPSGANAGFDH